jgi:hypothetical protein
MFFASPLICGNLVFEMNLEAAGLWSHSTASFQTISTSEFKVEQTYLDLPDIQAFSLGDLLQFSLIHGFRVTHSFEMNVLVVGSLLSDCGGLRNLGLSSNFGQPIARHFTIAWSLPGSHGAGGAPCPRF